MPEIVYKEESYQIMGACFEVSTEMGCGFLEAVYQECLSLEFTGRQIPFAAKMPLQLRYKERLLDKKYEPDFICFGRIILEIKAESKLTNKDRAQVHNYLHCTGYRLGLLVNFGHFPKTEWERVVM